MKYSGMPRLRRRAVLTAGLAAPFLPLNSLCSPPRQHAETAHTRSGVFPLTQQVSGEQLAWLYSEEDRARPGGSDAPHMYLHYDEIAKRFVSPLDLKPSIEWTTCTLESRLIAFNLSKSLQQELRPGQRKILLALNTSSGKPETSRLSWIFMNAVNVFLSKDEDRAAQLTKFLSSESPDGLALSSRPTVKVIGGKVFLQTLAYSHQPDGLWKQLFDVLTVGTDSAFATLVARGFGIPALALDGLKFVNHALESWHQQEALRSIWSTPGLEFAVHKEAKSRFAIRPGLWVTVDSAYARATELLSDHTLDLRDQTFQVLDAHQKPIDANYLVMEHTFSKPDEDTNDSNNSAEKLPTGDRKSSP